MIAERIIFENLNYDKKLELIKFYSDNPVDYISDILGIKLNNYQKEFVNRSMKYYDRSKRKQNN